MGLHKQWPPVPDRPGRNQLLSHLGVQKPERSLKTPSKLCLECFEESGKESSYFNRKINEVIIFLFLIFSLCPEVGNYNLWLPLRRALGTQALRDTQGSRSHSHASSKEQFQGSSLVRLLHISHLCSEREQNQSTLPQFPPM